MTDRSGVLRLQWDAWNIEHIAKHGVVPLEVEEVVAGRVVLRDGYKGRAVAVGPTRQRRMLAVVFGPVPGQPGVFYPSSARPASRQERRRYDQAVGGKPS